MKRFKKYISEGNAKGGYHYEDQVNGNLKKHGMQKKDKKVLEHQKMHQMELFALRTEHTITLKLNRIKMPCMVRLVCTTMAKHGR